MTHESTDRDILLSIYSDVYKDVYGIRPRGGAFPSDLSDEEIQAKLDDLQAELDDDLGGSDAFEDWRDDDAEDMDGDFDSGMSSAGFGTDEDYGCYGDDGW